MMSAWRIWRPGLLLGGVALVALAFLALSAAGPTVAAGATIRIESPQLHPGESATATLRGLGFTTPGLGAITVDVRYDPTAVAVTACKADPNGIFDMALCSQEFAADTVRVTAIHAQGRAGDFTLAEITMEALGEAGRPVLHVAIVTLADPTGADLDALIEDGAVSEPAGPPSEPGESVEPSAPLNESAEAPSLSGEGAGEAVLSAPGSLPATGGHPLLETDQPWVYLTVAALCLGTATVAFALIRRRRRA